MVLCGISLASSFSAVTDAPNGADFTACTECLGAATFAHTISGINLEWYGLAANYLKLYPREIIALHSGMNVTTPVIHGAVNRRLTAR